MTYIYNQIYNFTIIEKSIDFVINVDYPLFKYIRISWQNRTGMANVPVQCR